jgi:sugar phosphate isomerase/epimerase
MAQDRRTFLASLGAAALAAGCRGAYARLFPDASAKPARLGIQLYTVRRLATADLAGTLARLAKIGYREVELAGYYNRSAADFSGLLKENGLVAPSGHIAIDLIENNPSKTFADAHTVGHEWITVPSLPRGKRDTLDDWKRIAAQFNVAAARAKTDGFRFAFHNHTDIIKPVNAVTPIDVLMAETDPALVSFQMDIYWTVSGGGDPLALIQRHPGRFRMFHIKDGNPPYNDPSQTDIGQGAIDFKPILRTSGIEHWFVESDSAKDPIAFAANSFQYLNTMILK